MKAHLKRCVLRGALFACIGLTSFFSRADVTCEVTRINQWGTGYQADVTVSNSGAAVQTWEIAITMAAAPKSNAAWNATISNSGNSVIASNISWNGALPPGGSTSFGFTGQASNIQIVSCKSTSLPVQSSSVGVSSVVASSSLKSLASSSSSVSSASEYCVEMCQWYSDSPRPLCKNTSAGWGWENSQSCIGRSTCESQPANGVVNVCTPDTSSSSSLSSVTPLSSSSSSSSSLAVISSSSSSLSSLSSSSSSSRTPGDSEFLPRINIYLDGQTIVDDPKVLARMEVIEYDGNTPVTSYDGFAGIEIRGSSSQMLFPKKSFGLETRDANGEDLAVSLLGMPKEEDWIFYAPYSDKTFMRNTLMYQLSADAGHYASRWRYFDLYIDDDYQGLYVFMEKLKRDKNRIDIANLKEDEVSGEDLTGGYILKIDKAASFQNTRYPPAPAVPTNPWGGDSIWNWGWNNTNWGTPTWGTPTWGAGGGTGFGDFTEVNSFRSTQGDGHYFLYETPSAEDIVPEQKAYIQQVMAEFESALAGSNFTDATWGYRDHIDVDSFVDYFIFTQFSGDVDAFNMSTYVIKDKNDKIAMGPLWDFNLAFGNANYCDGWRYDRWVHIPAGTCANNAMFPMPFWWERLLQDSYFIGKLKNRWNELRSSTLAMGHIDRIMNDIYAELKVANAIERNQQVWPVIGQNVWPNYYVGSSYSAEVDYMKDWIRNRLNWMDSAISNL